MTPGASPVVLRVTDLRIAFTGASGDSERVVVDELGFDLRRGRVLALVGESGSGKSVTAMSTLGLLPPDATVSGSIRLIRRDDVGDADANGNGTGVGTGTGTDTGTADTDELIGADDDLLRAVRGGRIGTIFQEPMTAFNPVVSIGRQIGEALRAHAGGRGRAAVHERIDSLLTSAGIADPERVRRAFPHELSGGQLQRAMIAMALSGDPQILIADEPTTALDVTVQAGILDLLRELRDRLGMAILLITHDMGVVADLADDVIVMRSGHVVERAEASVLFAHPTEPYTKALLGAVPKLAELDIAAPVDVSERLRVHGAVERPRSGTPTSGTVDAAELVDVDIVYGGRRRASSAKAVDGVSLRIPAGRLVGLVGESGSGKSTIGRALAGLVTPRAGTVRVAGVDLTTASAGELRRARRAIGFVFQDPASSLNPRATIGDSIGEPLGLHSTLDRRAQRDRVRELLDAVQLPSDSAVRFAHELSGGQRQRVAIARAIALRPALLIADEPTSALDVSVQELVLDLLRDLQSDLGFACLFISHDLAVVSELVDEVAVMRSGKILERGPVDDVLRRPIDPYTQRLLAAAPVADPAAQKERREAWRRLARVEGAA